MRRVIELITYIVGVLRMVKMHLLRKMPMKMQRLHLHPEKHPGNPKVRTKLMVNINIIISVKYVFKRSLEAFALWQLTFQKYLDTSFEPGGIEAHLQSVCRMFPVIARVLTLFICFRGLHLANLPSFYGKPSIFPLLASLTTQSQLFTFSKVKNNFKFLTHLKKSSVLFWIFFLFISLLIFC